MSSQGSKQDICLMELNLFREKILVSLKMNMTLQYKHRHRCSNFIIIYYPRSLGVY